MERLIILVGQLYKSVAPTKYFFKVPLVGHCMPLVGVVHRPVEYPLNCEVPKRAAFARTRATFLSLFEVSGSLLSHLGLELPNYGQLGPVSFVVSTGVAPSL